MVRCTQPATRLRCTVGQTAIGAASDGYRLEAGYWYRVTGEPIICGDLNRDGVVTAADAAIALEIAAGGRPFDAAADVNGDGSVTSLDALILIKAAAGLIDIC